MATDKQMRGLRSALEDVRDFHEAMAAVYPEGADCTGRPGLTRRLSRLTWIRDELEELERAVEANDVVEGVDALLDITYFCLGTLVMWCGVERAAACWDEVQRSNMDKRQPDGTILVRESDGKIQKPEGWEPPKIAEILGMDR